MCEEQVSDDLVQSQTRNLAVEVAKDTLGHCISEECKDVAEIVQEEVTTKFAHEIVLESLFNHCAGAILDPQDEQNPESPQHL